VTAHERAKLVVIEMMNRPVLDLMEGQKLEAFIDELVNRVGEIFIDSVVYLHRED